MSIDFKATDKIMFSDIFDGRLEKYDVREHNHKDTSEKSRCLTDGRNYVWFYGKDDGTLGGLCVYGGNAPGRILGAIASAFDTDFVSEHDPQFWGFNSQEEWHQAMEEMGRKDTERFYLEVMKYVAGDPCDIRPGTHGMSMAEIAKDLIARDGGLASPGRQQELMDAVHEAWRTGHVVTVKLTDEQMALAKLSATHEDDLPQA